MQSHCNMLEIFFWNRLRVRLGLGKDKLNQVAKRLL